MNRPQANPPAWSVPGVHSTAQHSAARQTHLQNCRPLHSRNGRQQEACVFGALVPLHTRLRQCSRQGSCLCNTLHTTHRCQEPSSNHQFSPWQLIILMRTQVAAGPLFDCSAVWHAMMQTRASKAVAEKFNMHRLNNKRRNSTLPCQVPARMFVSILLMSCNLLLHGMQL